MTNPSEAFLAPGPQDEDELLTDLKQMVRNHANSHPRHNQKALGPSEVGHPCSRNIIARMLGFESINPQFDPLASYIGVASHAAMEDAARLDNERLAAEGKEGRWLPERKVHVRDGLSGTCDLYDTQTDTVVDYKFPGTSRMTLYRKQIKAGKPPSVIYRVQAHMYGRGYKREGFDVKRVGIWFLPRAGMLASSVLWTEPYDDELVERELTRLDNLVILADELDLENNPQRLDIIPKTPYECQFCPFFTVTSGHADAHACQGGDEFQPSITPGSGMAPPKST